MRHRYRDRRLKFSWHPLEDRAVPTTIVALLDSGVDLTSTADYPYYNFTNAYDAFDKVAITSSNHNLIQDTSLQHGHGSTVADFIIAGIQQAKASQGANSLDIEIMPIRETRPNSNTPDDAAVIRGIYWASDHGASVINMSSFYWPGYPANFTDKDSSDQQYFGTSLCQAISYAQSKGLAIVTAAGNTGANSDANYPGYMPGNAGNPTYNGLGKSLNNIIVTAAVDGSNALTKQSGWGPTSVNIGAPTGSGDNAVTSYSTGYTSGVMGAIAALAPTQTPAQWINIVEQTVTLATQNVGAWCTTGGVLNTAAAVSQAIGSTSTSSSNPVLIAVGSSSAIGNFAADTTYASGGTPYSNTDTIDTSAIPNPPPVDVFHNERWSNSSFTETISNLTPNAAYDVRLDFVEAFYSGAGMREFNVAINGVQLLTDFDIAAASGAKDKAVAVPIYHVAADGSGRLTFTFTNINGGAKVDGIEVTPSQTIAIAAGATSAVSDFSADTGYSASSTYAPSSPVTPDTSQVYNPPPAAVLNNSRWSNTNFTETILSLTPNATYGVRLDFDELYYSGYGQRSFNVAINNVQVLTNFDIAGAAGGPNIAVAKLFDATADSSGNIKILFTNVTGGATVNGIEISPSPVLTQGTPVDLSGAFNAFGITKDNNTAPGNLDGAGGHSYSATFVGPVVYANGDAFNLGAAGAWDVVKAGGQSIPLPQGNFSGVRLLATGLNGAQAGNFMVNYTDNTSTPVSLTFDDWHTNTNLASESVASLSTYRNTTSGRDTYFTNFYLYSYALAINKAKTVSSITLPNNGNIAIFGVDLNP